MDALDNWTDGSWDGLRDTLQRLGSKVGQWCGLPLPIEGSPLTIAPQLPFAKLFAEMVDDKTEESEPELEVVNSWWCKRYRATVHVYRENGRADYTFTSPGNPLDMMLKTGSVQVAWGLDQESNAIQTLGTLLKPRPFKSYFFMNAFMERSPRSGLIYVFRKLRPTVVLSERFGDSIKPIACLCLHPLGYYSGTWAGAMCPTDDVISHLMLMRGDEHRFWKQANQIEPSRPEAGLIV